MRIQKVTGKECRAFRPLWEEAFGEEENPAFTDYYFALRAPANRGYGLYDGKKLLSMLYLTPYQVLDDRLYYIVGVATGKDCRHRGYMRQLLREAMQDMRREGCAFTYLMPADPAIYRPFGFRYIYDRPRWELREAVVRQTIEQSGCRGGKQDKERAFTWRELSVREYQMLADKVNAWLAGQKQVFARRDLSYYTIKAAELRTEGGGIYGWFPATGPEEGEDAAVAAGPAGIRAEREPDGYVMISRDGAEDVEEAICFRKENHCSCNEKGGGPRFPVTEAGSSPAIMARILDVSAMLSRLRSLEPVELLFCLKDGFLPENSGLYRWRIDPERSLLQKVGDGHPEPEERLTVEELTDRIFGRSKGTGGWRQICPLSGVFLNEIV